jgi:Putative Ig domain
VTSGRLGAAYSYDVDATAFPGPITYSLDTAPSGMTIDSTSGLIEWTPGASGVHNVAVRASNGTNPDAVQAFQVAVPNVLLDDFNRANGGLGGEVNRRRPRRLPDPGQTRCPSSGIRDRPTGPEHGSGRHRRSRSS